MMQPISVFEARDILGEGPVWSVEEQAIYWIDIKRPCIRRWIPSTGRHDRWMMPAEIGCFALREKGGAVVALQNGFSLFDFESGVFEHLVDPEEHLPDNRFNDGKCDPQGRFWAGTMDNDEVAMDAGALYRLDPDCRVTQIRDGVGISNGLGWSPDHTTMYYADSPALCIYAYDFDPATGDVSNERVFAEVDRGVPDGLTVDSAGYVWNAQWDAWRVVRYAPDGSVDRIVDMPVQRPTSCMFGGSDLCDLYVTSASIHLTQDELEEQPDAGNLFRIRTKVAGMPEPRFAG